MNRHDIGGEITGGGGGATNCTEPAMFVSYCSLKRCEYIWDIKQTSSSMTAQCSGIQI